MSSSSPKPIALKRKNEYPKESLSKATCYPPLTSPLWLFSCFFEVGASSSQIRSAYLSKLGIFPKPDKAKVKALTGSNSASGATPVKRTVSGGEKAAGPSITAFYLLLFAALISTLCNGHSLNEYGDIQQSGGSYEMNGVQYVEFPRFVEATIAYELLTRHVPSCHEGGEEQVNVFTKFAQSLIQISCAEKAGHLLGALAQLKGSLAVVVSGAPQDPYVPSTPVDGRRSVGKKTLFAEIMSAGFAAIAGGNLINFPFEVEYSNQCFHEGYARQRGSAVSSDKSVGAHLEMSYLPKELIPDLLVLATVREGHDKLVETVLVDNAVVLSLLSTNHRSTLLERRFVLERPTWVDPEARHFFDSTFSIVEWNESDDEAYPMIRLPAGGRSKVRPLNPDDADAKDALDALYRAVGEAQLRGLAIKVHLKEGDILLFNNKRVLHSRNAYTSPKYDGMDRILVRSYYLFDLKGVDWERSCAPFLEA